MGRVRMPDGKRIAVNLGADFDAQAIWLGSFNMPIQSLMQRGQFGAEVGLPRLLEVWERYGVTTSVFAPGHSVDTFPEVMRRVVDAGHEVGHHGYYHENPTKISRETEKKLIQLGLNAFRNQLGVRPLGYRAPYWEHSESTLDLVEEFGFKYDSSLMGRDLQAYHPQRWQINWEKGNVAGRASRLLEIPVCWYIDDFPVLAYSHPQRGQQDTDTVLKRWCSMFDYAYERVDSPVFVSVVHPQVIGQGHHMLMYEQFVEYIAGKEGVWLATCEQIADAWEPDDDDRRKFDLPDVRGVETAPPDSGWA
jgi:peptidoglycan-N-acetylglucosamine deacetylase